MMTIISVPCLTRLMYIACMFIIGLSVHATQIPGIQFFNGSSSVATINTQQGKLSLQSSNGIRLNGPVTFNQQSAFIAPIQTSASTANAVTSLSSFNAVTINQSLTLSSAHNTTCASASDTGQIYFDGTTFKVCNGSAWKDIAIKNPTTNKVGASVSPGGVGQFSKIHAVSPTEIYVAYVDIANNSKLTVSQWNGIKWSQIGSHNGVGVNGFVDFYFKSGSDFYVAAYDQGYNNAVNVYHWNGSSWTKLGNGPNGTGNTATGYAALWAFSPSNVIIAFQDWGNSNKISAHQWNGTTWTQIGSLGVGSCSFSRLYALSATEVYVTFTDSGDSGTVVYKWNGTAWSKLGSSMTGSGFLDLAVLNSNEIYVSNSHQGGSVYKWNGTSWSQVGSSIQTLNPTEAGIEPMMHVIGSNDIYLTCRVSQTNKNKTYKWNGATWTQFGPAVGIGSGTSPDIFVLPNGSVFVSITDSSDSNKLSVYRHQYY